MQWSNLVSSNFFQGQTWLILFVSGKPRISECLHSYFRKDSCTLQNYNIKIITTSRITSISSASVPRQSKIAADCLK